MFSQIHKFFDQAKFYSGICPLYTKLPKQGDTCILTQNNGVLGCIYKKKLVNLR